MRFGLALLFLPASSFALTLAQFQTQMQQKVAALASTTTATVYMQVLGTQQELFAHNPDTALVPASASKLVTTSAALQGMGPTFTYMTHVQQIGNDLIVVGSGDPYIVSQYLIQLAQATAAKTRHVGSIRIDNSVWSQDYLGLAQFAGFDGETDASVVSPTSLNYNLLSVTVTPSASGHPAIVAGPSHNGYAIFRSTVTQVAGSGSSLTMHSEGMQGNQEVFAVSGSIGKSAKAQSLQLAVRDPEAYFAYAFAGVLRDQGVVVDEDFGGSSFVPIAPNAPLIATLTSLPFTHLADLYMTYSNNFMAEQTFQTLGQITNGGQAGIGSSVSAMAGYLSGHSACANAVMANGSGLTWDNKVSGRCFVQTIQELPTALYTDLIATLPVGDQPGTLSGRFAHPPAGFHANAVHAKTGTLWSQVATSALIGISPAGSGQIVIFALVENDRHNVESVTNTLKAWEDGVVELIQQLRL